jgi:hypothetical protein
MKKLLFAFLFMSIAVSAQEEKATTTQEVKPSFTIEEGTIIKFAIDYDVSGKTLNPGDKINFTTTEDLIQGNYVVFHKGLKVVGTVTEAEKSKALGKKGKLSFSIDYLYLNNGKVIKLRNDVSKNLKGSGGAVAAGAIVLAPFVLLFNGKNAKFKKGDLFEAYVDEKTTVN